VRVARSRRAIRSITFGAFRAFGGSATIPLASRLISSLRRKLRRSKFCPNFILLKAISVAKKQK
jgi:hypothetical protein